MNLDTFLDDLFIRGVLLAADGDQLQLRGAKGVLTPQIVGHLKEHKADILGKLSQPAQRYPLSYGQESLWSMVQNATDNPLYNVSIALRIHSQIDLVALQRTFQAFIVRHPLLRTTFNQADGKVEQWVERCKELALARRDAQGLTDEQLDAEVLSVHEQPFDLVQGPLMRVNLFTRTDEDHVLLCTIHHIITDGWSLWMLLDEFRHLYAAAQRGPLTAASLSTLPKATRSYEDYVTWQREMVATEGERLWAYWEEKLSGELPMLDLPTDRPRPRVQSYRGASHHFALSAQLSQQLKQLAQSEGTTLYTLLQSAFQVLLYRYTGQEDILVGSPTAGRSKPEFAPIFGYFTSPVVVRGDLTGNPRFQDFLGQMRTTVLQALSHQDMPFGLLVDRLQPARDISRPPLYQATFALQKPQQTDHVLNADMAGDSAQMNWGGLLVSPYELGQYQGRVDIFLEMLEGQESITATFRYSTDLFDASTVAQMAERFITLLNGIVENPAQQIAQMPLLSAAEEAQVMAASQGRSVAYPEHRCVHELFEEQAASSPDVDALVFLEEAGASSPIDSLRLTYGELNNRANQLAHYLRSRGVGQAVGAETLVGISLDRSLDMVVSILAIMKAGGAYVPLDPAYPQERLAFMVADSGLGLILTTESLSAVLPETTATHLCLDQMAAEIAEQSRENPKSGVTAERLAYVIYTSGSTGKPKGVMVEHRGIPNLAYAQMNAFGLSADSRVLQFASFNFDASVSELFKTLLAGATLYMAERNTLLPGPSLVDLFNREAITMVTLPPSVLAVLPFDEMPALQSLIVAGEACSVELAQRWAAGRRLLNAYGPTEATVCATIGELTPEAIAATPRFLSIGQPMDNVQVYILDPYQQPVPQGIPGEIYIGGPGLARGYLNRPELTAEKFITNPFATMGGGDRLYRTGDRARYLPASQAGHLQIEFLGRMDNQVKLRGFRIELGEIEEVLMQHEAVQEAAVMMHEDDAQNQQLVAYIAPQTAVSEVEGAHVSYWQNVNTQIFGNAQPPADLAFNITGWGNSYTGQPLAAEEMQEWVDGTVAAVLALQPKRVLEIGCGTGLLVSRIAPHCESYVGADFSPEVLQNIQQLKASDPALNHVTLQQRTAENFDGIEDDSFDVVILNSVIQYFPNIDYLRRVLSGAVRAARPGGKVFVGDVRSLPHLEAYHAAVQMASATSDLTREQVAQQVQRTLQEEEELVIDPKFFMALQEELPEVGHVEIQLKRGKHHNELMQFRYAATLHVESDSVLDVAPDDAIRWLDWETDEMSLERLQQLLIEEQPTQLGVRHIPNLRVQKATAMAAWLNETHEERVGDLLPQLAENGAALDPETLWNLGETNHYEVDLTWSEMGDYLNGMDLLFRRPDSKRSATLLDSGRDSGRDNGQGNGKSNGSRRDWSTYANNPLQGTMRRKLVPQLNEFLLKRVPGYMVPNTFMLLDRLPLNNSGKVDRHALPAPMVQRTMKNFVPPTTAVEKQLAVVWREILGIERVSIHDDFFDLGGNSLLMVQLTSGMSSAMDRQVSARTLMLNPTIAQLAQHYDAEIQAEEAALKETEAAMQSASQNGTKPSSPAGDLPDVPHIRWEKRSLLSLFVTGKLPPIDVAALAYLSSTGMKNSGMSRDEVVYECFENLPLMSSIMETPWGRVGLITLPRMGSELYQDEEVMDLILEALQMAGRFGAKVVSLTGLIPSATDYGHSIVRAMNGQKEMPQVTTGHATTSASVLLSMQRLLDESKRDIRNETVGFIGLGSVGMATLHLMLQAMPHPKSIILCDLFSKIDTLEETKRDLVEEYGYEGEIQVATSRAEAPMEIYNSTFIVGATNVPDVLDIMQVKPGTLIVDDSAPHCFDYQQAIQRAESQEDILFTEGGVLELPTPVQYHVHASRQLKPMMQDTRIFREFETTGCVFSSVLSSLYAELEPTVGMVDPRAGVAHYTKLQELGIRAAALHCREYKLPKRLLRSFRYRFNDKSI